MIPVRHRARTLCLWSIATFAIMTPLRGARGDEPGPALLVVALPEGTCSIDGAIEGASPLVARPPAGSHAVECWRELSGVKLRRKRTVTTEPGKPAKVVVDLRGGT
jgi:hypothetical protein